jgi:ABC-type branched-subunit amino acid transport system ATPase component
MALSGKLPTPVKRLEADSIWLEYGGRNVLQNIYIKVEVGQITGLFGRNGCGKSSLLQVIYGTRSAQNSSVRLDGHYVERVYRHRNKLAYLPQHQFVPTQLRVAEAFDLYESSLANAHVLFPELSDLLAYRFNQLSGGQQRLLETIMVVTSPAPFVLLDEPFSNVMPLHVESLSSLLIVTRASKGILLTDHYYHDVLAISDVTYLLTNNGRSILLRQPEQELRDYGYLT